MAQTKKNAADVKNVNAKNNNAAENGAQNTQNATPEKLTAVDVVALSAAWIKQYGTIAAIRADYAALTAQYGKDNYKDVLKNAQTIRNTEIQNAADRLNADVFTFSGISGAVLAAVRRSTGYAELCKFARREYSGEDAAVARAVIRDYYANVDANGAPLCRVSHVSADATQILSTYELKTLTFGNAVQILKSSLDGMKSAAVNAATRQNGNDAAAATRNNVRVVGSVVAVYAAAVDETGRVSVGQRRDNNADAKTRETAAQYVGKTLPVGYVPVATYNAYVNGNDAAADVVERAHNAAKDAAAAAGHAAVVK